MNLKIKTKKSLKKIVKSTKIKSTMKNEISMKTIFKKSETLIKHLKQTSWPPMTYMMIPSVLKRADDFIKFLEGVEDMDAKALYDKLVVLRADFKRIS